MSAQNATMSMPTQILGTSQIQKGFNLLGLELSEPEMNELQHGNTVSLEGRRLSEIGSVFILAEALSALYAVKNITFGDLLKSITGSISCSGIPVYHWNSNEFGKCYLLLTVEDGKPAVKILFQQ